MQDNFYLRLEQRFRGSESQIAQRLGQYIPLLESLEQNSAVSALDLGCGRGEWLSILAQRQWRVRGVDLNASMVERCQKQGFEVHQQDALSCLKALPAESVTLISGFHIVEHMTFDALLEILGEAWRVLAPQGVLLFETPNPENLTVGAHTFYMDPSHRHPLPPQLLQFAAQEQGFAQVDIRRLNGAARPENSMAFGDHLEWFFEANQDYVVFAQKNASVLSAQVLERIGEAHAHTLEFYGIAREYVEETYQRIQRGVAIANQQQVKITALHEQLQAFEQQVRQKEAHIQQLVQQNEVYIKQHQEALAQLHSSGLMRLVRLLCRVRRLAGHIRHHGLVATGQLLGQKLSRGVAVRLMARPRLRKWALRCLCQSPSKPQSPQGFFPVEQSSPNRVFDSPRAGEIWRDLDEP